MVPGAEGIVFGAEVWVVAEGIGQERGEGVFMCSCL